MTDRHPVISDEYYDRIMFPLLAVITYNYDLNRKWFLLSRIKSGYLFADFRFSNTTDGFTFHETGGVIFNFDFGIGKEFVKYSPFITFGYEFN